MTMTERLPATFHLTGDWAVIQGTDWVWPMRLMIDALPAPPFVQSTPYVAGTYLVPQVGGETGFTYLVVTAGTSAAANPTWPTVKGDRVTSGGAVFMAIGSTVLLDTSAYTARFTVNREIGSDQAAFASTFNGYLTVGFDPPKWAVATVKALGNRVVPTTPNGWVYEAVVAGTTHATTEATWPTTLGAVVTDNTVTWRNVSTDDSITNLRIALPGSYTAGLADWGKGYYDVEIYDAFSVPTRILEGNAVLSLQQTLS